MLFLLVTAQRCQTLHTIKLSDIKRVGENIFIQISTLLKQSRPGFSLEPIILQPYKLKKNLCIVTTLNNYIARSEHYRIDESLIISTVKPH
jgi:hypothetical protein